MKESIHAAGHENVSAEHASTFEITTDDWLTPAGDCILAVEADRAPADFDSGFVAACRDTEAVISTVFETNSYTEKVVGRGDPDLSFESERSMVGRTSEYVDERTFVIGVERPARGFDRGLVEALSAGAELTVTVRVD